MKVERMIVSSDEVGWAAPPYVLEVHVALMPPRRRISFLLSGAVSSSILR
jgi:hypothetical protein